ncbi:MAG: hypothetical protein V3V14_01790 [Saprospiraceae bacterium]
MKKINSIYIIGVILAIGLFYLFNRIQTESVFFYGFAENKETEINHDKDVLIDKILVVNGQEVKKGDLLIEVFNTDRIPTKINALNLEKQEIDVNTILKKQEVEHRIRVLETEKDSKLLELKSKIKTVKRKIELNKSLFKDLKSIDRQHNVEKLPIELELDFLRAKQQELTTKYDQDIAFYNRTLNQLSKPSKIKKNIVNSQLEKVQSENDKIQIFAPSDGLIGSVFCKEGEHITAFSTLMNFYKHNPTQVKGYVHESLILKVKVGDKLEVTSSLHANHKIIGEVLGLGSRIVEIPERLRKNAEIRTYGREVLIKIAAENNFLQKEKVMLNTSLYGGETLETLFSQNKSKIRTADKKIEKSLLNDN